MRVALISPRLALQKGDFLGSGVPYWPLELATLAALAREQGDVVALVDLFGNAPHRLEERADHYLQGDALDDYLGQAALAQSEAFIVYAISYMSHQELLDIVRILRATFPAVPVAVLENSQAVTAYSLPRVAADFFAAGADALVCGEAVLNWPELRAALHRPPRSPPRNMMTPNSAPPQRLTRRGASYPVPAWDLVNMRGYWSLPYSHGPKTPTYLPILTSRGCPYPCDFCVVPETNDRAWRGNDPRLVVDEILALRDRHGVRDFQVEDLNPTVQHKRWEAICEELIARDAGIRFYLVSGTKAETVRLGTVELLARAGCRYISFSPESGSPRLMKTIGKPFDYEHGVALVARCRAAGIRTQACFLVGHPGETAEDAAMSRAYLARLVRAGLDEVAVFIVAAFAGSLLFERNAIATRAPAALPSFSPRGRADFAELKLRRRRLVATFFVGKLARGFDLWAQGLRALFGRPATKMENLPRRMLFITWLLLRRPRPASRTVRA